MELREYVAVVGRRWRWLAVCLLACLLVALSAALLTPRTWTAQTEVFVSSTTENVSPSFLQQRVKSYPDVASSAEVLDPVRDTLGLDMSLAQLRAAVDAENPVDTSQINISVTVDDPRQAADIADAVAEEFSSAVERLETTGSGSSPVTLTVTNPATVPTSPTSPQVSLLVALGLVCGLGTGIAAAVVRDRWDTRVWTPDDVRSAWGATVPDVLSTRGRREPGDRAAQVLARRVERRAQDGPVRVLIVAPNDRATPAVADLTADLTDVLTRRGLLVESTDQPATPAASTPDAEGPASAAPRDAAGDDEQGDAAPASGRRPDVVFSTVAPDAALTTWRAEVSGSDGVVVVCPPGSADRVDVFELGQLLDGVEAVTVGVVFTAPGHRGGPDHTSGSVAPATTPASPPAPARQAATRRPSADDTGWARLTSPTTSPTSPTPAGPTTSEPTAEDRPGAVPARPGRPHGDRPTVTPVRSNRVAGSSRRVPALSRNNRSQVTVRIPPAQDR
ncbi:Capsular polysaccharide biosynthesis protein [Klenkia marina]|uniref:Capsular polysaccharide biosynthesis protein n=1 Tax=Klenkia marina TaxID=1960309 RepID=A0A1G4XFU7_9ACTN|nr:Wzz/FepE/Etk N-terminal domain-containing protein [Klenkia marina]SCX40016.1 Capsular polysaccharide biosynthesis protein [Klenkia marina]